VQNHVWLMYNVRKDFWEEEKCELANTSSLEIKWWILFTWEMQCHTTHDKFGDCLCPPWWNEEVIP